jgi:undecaprenyl-diphosphatase
MMERSALTVSQTLKWLAELDTRLFLGLNSRQRRSSTDRTIRLVSSTGDGYLYILMGLLLPLVYPAAGTAFLLALLLGFLMELPVYWILKNSFKRRRPFRVVKALAPVLNPSDEFSFPSGHTTAAFMVAGITTVCFPAASEIVYLWAALIGLSRVMLKVHFVSDVLAGIALGSLFAFLSLWMLSGY